MLQITITFAYLWASIVMKVMGCYSEVIRQHTSAYVSIRQHTSAYVSIRQHTSAYASIRQHTPAYASIRQQTPAYVSYSEVKTQDLVRVLHACHKPLISFCLCPFSRSHRSQKND
jgi:hypothetical protein